LSYIVTNKNAKWLLLLLVVWCVLAGSLQTAIISAAFCLLLIIPLWMAFRQLLEHFGMESPLSILIGGLGCLSAIPFLFLLRKIAPIPDYLFDISLVICFSGFGYKFLKKINWIANWGDRSEISWLLIVLSLLFILPRLGNEVRTGDEVRYYGLFFVDFGNLRSVVNILNASPGPPEIHVIGSGPLAYHWFFFAIPAWISSFFGTRLEACGTLNLATYLSAVLFFKCCSYTSARVLEASNISKNVWCTWGAGIGIVGLSTSYFYRTIIELFHLEWFIQGTRNHLLLHLPNSVNVFGNNTYALSLCLMSAVTLIAWNSSGKKVYLITASTLVALIPAYSVTLCMGIALGLTLACVLGIIRNRWFTLVAFGVIGAAAMWTFTALGMFSGRSESPKFLFDNGRFFLNVIFSNLPAALAVGMIFFSVKDTISKLLLCIILGTFLIPTLMVLQNAGHPGESVLSMKTASLITALCVPLTAKFIAKLWLDGKKLNFIKLTTTCLLLIGIINTSAYAFSGMIARFKDSPARAVIGASHFDALHFIRENTVPTAIILDPIELKEHNGEPAVLVGARRVLLANEYSLSMNTNPKIVERNYTFYKWQATNFKNADLSKYFSIHCDKMLSIQALPQCDWQLDAQFGNILVYRSLHHHPE